ncbi:MAG: hypothetical protein MUE84_14320 [Hyphomonas sp.]|jgi:rhamnosyltransferase|nr:hypothetical protein [Hyphomonas sp.]
MGLGVALNGLMRRAAEDGFDELLLFDQDSSPQPSLPEVLLRSRIHLARRYTRIAGVGPMLAAPTSSDFLPIPYAWRKDFDSAAHFVPTSGSLVSIAAWRDVGPFREDCFVGGIDVE